MDGMGINVAADDDLTETLLDTPNDGSVPASR